MSITVLLAVLAAAFVHAGWNAIIKGAADKLAMTLAVALGAGVVAVCVLPFLPQPAPASWPYVAGSIGLQTTYYLLIARAYRLVDMSLAYPLMRGLAPLLVAVASVALVGEMLHPAQWAGVALVSGGILAMAALNGRAGNLPGIATSVLNAGFIAGYTLVDGLGVRASGAPAAYTLWLAAGTALSTFAVVSLSGRRPKLTPRAITVGIVGGAATTVSYGIALWAMTQAPLALVAALRETSILFALAISALVLSERVGARRLATTVLMIAGVLALRLG